MLAQLIVLGLLLSLPAATAYGQSAVEGCIQTPKAYKAAFESCEPVACVSPNLYATIIVDDPAKKQASIYPPGFHWAWTSGDPNLKVYADWHRPVCKDHSKGSTVSNRMLLYVGFGQKDINLSYKGKDLTLEVMDLSKDPSLFKPTADGWFQAFQQEYNVAIPLKTQEAMTLGLGVDDPPRSFTNITGCSAEAAAMCKDGDLNECGVSYRKMAARLKSFSPYDDLVDSTTQCCVSAFKNQLAGREPDPAETRALLFYCQDVNPCNTFLGYGYNPEFPSAGGSPAAHFTGPEFVLHNQKLDTLDAVAVPLPVIQ
jgi:hypothetical protein